MVSAAKFDENRKIFSPFPGATTLATLAAGFARFITSLPTFIAVWFAAVKAQKHKGWRSLLFPIVTILVPFIGNVILAVLAEGAVFTLDTFLVEAGVISSGP